MLPHVGPAFDSLSLQTWEESKRVSLLGLRFRFWALQIGLVWVTIGARFWVRDHVHSDGDPHHTTPSEKKGSQGLASLGAFGASGGVICKNMHTDNFGG